MGISSIGASGTAKQVSSGQDVLQTIETLKKQEETLQNEFKQQKSEKEKQTIGLQIQQIELQIQRLKSRNQQTNSSSTSKPLTQAASTQSVDGDLLTISQHNNKS
ncbi:hypothetical protein [Sporolactobacillus terrae]|uniref:FlxA-like family protein n=1 Tax=Sporolactobacillus terrae TaxID=269673 RepID=A0A410DA13_9BACL|nr:hypothetical protein [Sporolactobacillus terrae]QAA22972.1 hypothetical protein C0674_10245 [Sporolactobacillus terrae]QAA25945.1 hypothetical protein C0679_10225 [Sporolactobacillus terrae]UAK15045.1 hypothetical protein K7399_07915 [Sporolactobacillus terrae]BBN99373.1 hypothetical protein St703_20780 [Sporolactobacillus terrae]